MKKMVIFIFIFTFLFVGQVLAYDFGEEVVYNNIKFNVIKDNGDSVTLLKSKPLHSNDLNNFGSGHVNMYNQFEIGRPSIIYTKEAVPYGGMAYYSSKDCTNIGNIVTSGCKINYDESDVKYVVDSWTERVIKKEDLKKDNFGYESRLLTKQEIEELFGFEYKYNTPTDTVMTYSGTADTPSWLFYERFWLMNPSDDGSKVYVIVNSSHSLEEFYVLNHAAVRPVITINKMALQESTNQEKKYSKDNIKNIFDIKHAVDSVIYYNDTKFYVISNINTNNEKIITLLKAEPLTVEDVNKFGTGHINNYTEPKNVPKNINGYGGVAYYSSAECNENVKTNCFNEYDKSDIKYIIDAWIDSIFSSSKNTLSDISLSYTILTYDDLLKKLEYSEETVSAESGYIKILSPINDYDNISVSKCWSSYYFTDDSFIVFAGSDNNDFMSNPVYSADNVVCPVITLKTNLETPKENSSVNEIVKVPNTISSKNIFVFIIGIFFTLLVVIIVFKNKKAD